MVKKLKLLWANPIASRLLFKTALVLVAFLGVRFFGFSFWPISFFVLILTLIYFFESPERIHLRNSFFILAFVGLFGLSRFVLSSLSASVLINLIVFIVLGTLFFVILGLVAFIFPNRFSVYSIFNTILLTLIFLVHQFMPWSFFINTLVLFLILAFIFRETFIFSGVNFKDRVWFTSFVLGFLAIEFSWFLSFLPLGVINSAVFLALFFLLVRDTLIVHFRGYLNLSFVFRQLTIFIFLSIVIFAASGWTI